MSQQSEISSISNRTAPAPRLRVEKYRAALGLQQRYLECRLPGGLDLARQVAATSVRLARALRLPTREVYRIRMAAQLHLLGMMGLPRDFPRFNYKHLPEQDRQTYEQYPVIGEQAILGEDFTDEVAFIVRHHRENFDGSGYPDRLAGRAIPTGSLILGLVSDFERVRQERGLDEALDLIRDGCGYQYDPLHVMKLTSLFEDHNREGSNDIRPDLAYAVAAC